MARTAPPDAPFVTLNRDLAPTPAASDFNNRLIIAGHKHANLGQGSEKTPLIPAAKRLVWAHLYEQLAQKKTESDLDRELDSEMNYNPNGDAALEAAVSGWSARIFGFGGHAKTTCVAQQLGRGIIDNVAVKWAAKYRDEYKQRDPKPVALVPANSWALTNAILEEAGFGVVDYKVDPDNISGSYKEALDAQVKEGRVVGISYFNFPHNATGKHLTSGEHRKIKAHADEYNRASSHKMMMLHDMPYFAACRKSAEGAVGYLDTGMEGVFNDKDFDPGNSDPVITPVAIGCSGSKFFRTAKQGFSWGHFTKDLIKPVRAALNKTGNGPRLDPEFKQSMEKALQPEHDMVWHEQLDLDSAKFEENYKFLCDVFGEDLVQGGANLVELVKLKNVFNKAVLCHDGIVRHIGAPGSQSSRQDILEILANGTPDEDGVLLVDGDKTWEGEDLLRLAAAKTPAEFQPDILRLARIAQYIKDSKNSDDLAPAP
ncbi:MAG: aminotransferase class I/II-fold pyridoxal phosphate-dependent enzyme [Alphaproteobacteria bacterium]